MHKIMVSTCACGSITAASVCDTEEDVREFLLEQPDGKVSQEETVTIQKCKCADIVIKYPLLEKLYEERGDEIGRLTEKLMEALRKRDALAKENFEIKNILSGKVKKGLSDACMNYRHDFGLLPQKEQAFLRLQAKSWLEAWGKVILLGREC